MLLMIARAILRLAIRMNEVDLELPLPRSIMIARMTHGQTKFCARFRTLWTQTSPFNLALIDLRMIFIMTTVKRRPFLSLMIIITHLNWQHFAMIQM